MSKLGIYLTEEERAELTEMTDEELCEKIEISDTWDLEMAEEACDRAGLLSAFLAADGEHFEEVIYFALDILWV
jgi:hypothetical protein